MNETEIESHAGTSQVDVIIAGGGIAGILTAARLIADRPELSVLLLETEETPGGRAKTLTNTRDSSAGWSYGLGSLSDDLVTFWDQALKTDPEASDLTPFLTGRVETFGELSSGKLSQLPVGDLPTAKGARLIGGLAASRDWQNPLELTLAREGEEQTPDFSTFWKKGRKSPASLVMEAIGPVLGVPDIWAVAPAALRDRLKNLSKGPWIGDWLGATWATLDLLTKTGRFTFLPASHVVSAHYRDQQWYVKSRKGEFQSAALVIAQPPWQTIEWLAQSDWSPVPLQIANRTRPVSMVVVFEKMRIPRPEAAPDLLWIAAEQTLARFGRDGTVCLQVALEFEMSMDHPTVVKAVRRIKRAKKRLEGQFPGLLGDKDHIALLPVAWAPSALHADRRWLAKLDNQAFQKPHLCWVGDAWGSSYDGDANIIRSVTATAQMIATKGKGARKVATPESTLANEADLSAIEAPQ